MSKKILGLAPCPVGWGVAWLIPENIHLLHLCYRAKFGSFWSNHTIAFTEIPAKISRFAISWSLKVTETDTDRSATYDFLLVIHSNYGRILCHFLDKRQFRSIFPTPVYLMPQLKGFPLEARGLKWSHSYQIGWCHWRQWTGERFGDPLHQGGSRSLQWSETGMEDPKRPPRQCTAYPKEISQQCTPATHTSCTLHARGSSWVIPSYHIVKK